MTTDDLINSLSDHVAPVSPYVVEQRVVFGMVAGAVVSFVVMVGWIGFRPDMPDALMSVPFWMKWAYTMSLGVLALAATAHVARPDAPKLRRIWLLGAPVAALAAIAFWELVHTPASGWLSMWVGVSGSECSVRVAALAVPVFGGLLWSFRALAPSNLRGAGAAAGLAAGAFAATVYGFHCPEVAATFVITWYTLGIATVAAFGALVGPVALRW
ncbi:MAG: DUF1109 domain-containing protein [Sphingomonas sp.]|jgi:hypothetical protein